MQSVNDANQCSQRVREGFMPSLAGPCLGPWASCRRLEQGCGGVYRVLQIESVRRSSRLPRLRNMTVPLPTRLLFAPAGLDHRMSTVKSHRDRKSPFRHDFPSQPDLP
jgi:hypothetical protein